MSEPSGTAPPPLAADELEWLEPPRSPTALAWAEKATQRSEAALQALPAFARLQAELAALIAGARPSASISLAGGWAFRLVRSARHPMGVLQRARRGQAGLEPWLDLLDVDALAAADGAHYMLRWDGTHVSPDGRRALLVLHPAGGDESLLRELDLDTGTWVPDGFMLPASRMQAAWVDGDTLLLGHTLPGEPVTMTGWPACARLWRRGTPVESAQPVLQLPASHALFMPVHAGGNGHAVLAVAVRFSETELYLVGSDASVHRLPLPTATGPTDVCANRSHVFAKLTRPQQHHGKQVPADSVVALALHGPATRFEVVHVPAEGEAVEGLVASGAGVAFVSRQGPAMGLQRSWHDGRAWRSETLLEPQPGVTPGVAGADRYGDAFVAMRQGFLLPPEQWLLAPAVAPQIIDQVSEEPGPAAHAVEQRQARSGDGTLIDYLIVGPRDRSGPVPVLMTGYGAFGVSTAPAHPSSEQGQYFGGPTLKMWLDRGRALVVASIRGGGERGSAWHVAAMREHRQRSYDDFHAVAEDLVAQGIARPGRIGVFGMSNGGLLAAVAGTQRPDLYGAIVSDAPLADMLRFPAMGMGAAWTDEYGDPADPAAAARLRRYSPVHNVWPDRAYPRFLITVATSDNRVGPGHARKLAWRLQDAGASVHFIEMQDGGHSVSDSLQVPALMAMRIAFLLDALPATAA
ncbi:MAG: S9 family peptidase [Burkholderiales bacterium]|nr:S9 family peptidase [Burkholderiales bacterium]